MELAMIAAVAAIACQPATIEVPVTLYVVERPRLAVGCFRPIKRTRAILQKRQPVRRFVRSFPRCRFCGEWQ